MNARTRFAPSPTGFMHVGGVRTALFAWLYARKTGGQFILRIEDTDKAREVDGSIAHIIESLKWLGIDWDEGVDIGGPHAPYLQSERLARYHEVARELVAHGYAYPDPYTKEELDAFRKQAEDEKRPFLFRHHRPDTTEEWDGSKPLRFKVLDVKKYTWTDAVRGELSAGEEALDDFILIKEDGFPTYNFAHIVDDYDMQVTHIMRGEEFISSTPKFLSLYDALGYPRPVLATMPVILGEAGTKKLGKRDGAKDILEYRAEGILPEAMRNFLALLGWHPSGDEEVLSTEDILKEFTLERIQKAGAKFDEEKLLHLNREWMRKLSDEEYTSHELLKEFNKETVLKIVPLLKERAHTFGEAHAMLTGELDFLFTEPILVRSELTEKGGNISGHLEHFITLLGSLRDKASMEEIQEACMEYANAIPKDEGGRGAALWPLRYALTGKRQSPDPFSVIRILGVTRAIERIETARKLL